MIETKYAEFISPCFHITIGDYEIKKITSANVISSRINPCDLTQINIDSLEATGNDFEKGDQVSIAMGYKEMGFWNVYNGYITDVSMQRTINLFSKDPMVKLEKRISKTFINATPQEIISFCLRAAGVNGFILSSKNLPKKHHFILTDNSIIDAIRLINRTWGLDDWAFYFEPEGSFYWGPWDESERFRKDLITVFESQKNIINLTPSNEETGTMETILLPFLRHSTTIEIFEPRYWRRAVFARIERITHRVNENYARTFVEWRILQN